MHKTCCFLHSFPFPKMFKKANDAKSINVTGREKILYLNIDSSWEAQGNFEEHPKTPRTVMAPRFFRSLRNLEKKSYPGLKVSHSKFQLRERAEWG